MRRSSRRRGRRLTTPARCTRASAAPTTSRGVRHDGPADVSARPTRSAIALARPHRGAGPLGDAVHEVGGGGGAAGGTACRPGRRSRRSGAADRRPRRARRARPMRGSARASDVRRGRPLGPAVGRDLEPVRAAGPPGRGCWARGTRRSRRPRRCGPGVHRVRQLRRPAGPRRPGRTGEGASRSVVFADWRQGPYRRRAVTSALCRGREAGQPAVAAPAHRHRRLQLAQHPDHAEPDAVGEQVLGRQRQLQGDAEVGVARVVDPAELAAQPGAAEPEALVPGGHA